MGLKLFWGKFEGGKFALIDWRFFVGIAGKNSVESCVYSMIGV